MNILELAGLFAVMALLALVPSSSVALVVARSATAGFKHGAAVALGIVMGDLVFVFLAISGLAVLADVMGGFFLVLKYLAGLYLICLGISLMRTKRPIRIPLGRAVTSLPASLLSGLIITLGDVKAIFFYASLFPVFVDLANVNASDVATLVLVTVVAVGGVKLAYAYSASRLVTVARGLEAQRRVKFAAGGLMLGAGTYLLVKA